MYDDPLYNDLCYEHDDDWNSASNILELVMYDIKFAINTWYRSLYSLRDFIRGVLIGLVVLVFSPILYLLKDNK